MPRRSAHVVFVCSCIAHWCLTCRRPASLSFATGVPPLSSSLVSLLRDYACVPSSYPSSYSLPSSSSSSVGRRWLSSQSTSSAQSLIVPVPLQVVRHLLRYEVFFVGRVVEVRGRVQCRELKGCPIVRMGPGHDMKHDRLTSIRAAVVAYTFRPAVVYRDPHCEKDICTWKRTE